MLKAVIDTNVWMSALFTPGIARDLVNRLRTARFQLVYSEEILAEFLAVTSRPKLAARFRLADKTDLMNLIQQRGILVEVPYPLLAVSRDPKDDMYLACAVRAQCEFIVSGDKDLLCLSSHGDSQIIQPAEFLRILDQRVPEMEK